MRITLVQPAQGSRFGLTKIVRVEPLGLECVSAALKLHDHEVGLVDLRLDGPAALVSHLHEARPDAVGISCGFTSDVYTSLQAARLAKEALPGVVVFTGGHHASLIPGDLLFVGSPVDAVVIGQGERTALELADVLESGDDPAGVPGVMTRDTLAEGFVERPFGLDLNSFPLPDRELSRRYRRRYHHGFRAPSASVETSRGCPFNCNFCSVWVFYQRRSMRRSTERILEDLEQVRRLGEDNVFFTDDIAFMQREAYEELGDAIRSAGLGMSFASETRADLVVKHRDLLRRWSEIGLHLLFLGVEKIDDVGLASVRKRTRGGAATNLEAIEILRGCGISPLTTLIVDPMWGEEDFDRLEEFVRQFDLPNPGFTILTPLPGTELWEDRKSELTTTDYSYFDVMHLTLPSRLPPKEFYERFARLYAMADVRTQIGWSAARKLMKMTVRGQGFAVRRVLAAAREMRSPQAYLANPGPIPKPSWVPQGFGESGWVDRSRSPVVERTLQAAAG